MSVSLNSFKAVCYCARVYHASRTRPSVAYINYDAEDDPRPGAPMQPCRRFRTCRLSLTLAHSRERGAGGEDCDEDEEEDDDAETW
jgi:hypothetical protein